MILTREERRAVGQAWRMLDLNRARFALAVAFGSLGLGASVGLTAVAAWLIARASQMPPVLDLSVAAVAVRTFGIARSVLRYLERLASHDVALKGMGTLREQIYARLAESPAERVSMLERGDLLTRTGADIDSVGDLVVRAIMPATVALTVGIGTVTLVAWLHPVSGLILAACLLLAGILGPVMAARGARAAERSALETRAEISATAMTLVDYGPELTVNGTYAALRDRLRDAESRLSRLQDASARPTALAAGTDILGMALAVLGALAVGIPAVTAGSLTPVELAVVVLTPLAAFEGTAMLPAAAVQLVRSAGAAVRVMAILNTPPDRRTEHVPDDAAPVIEARALSVAWPEHPVVAEGIDLTIRPGRSIALVGPSGIGKTTLLATLAGLLPARSGSVAVAGIEIGTATRASVTRIVTMTAEDAHVFNTTVLENLRVARGDVTEEEATELLARCGLADWLGALPGGLQTMLGSDAATISGGERRRLLLARALASPAPLLLIDEPAEHLDSATAAELMRDLLALTSAGRGVVVATHHLDVLEGADEVIWLDAADGPARVMDRGTHIELMERHASYADAAGGAR